MKIKIKIIEIYSLLNQIVMICKIDGEVLPKAGMYLKDDNNSFKILAVGHLKNLINSPVYKNKFLEENIRELYFMYSKKLLESCIEGMVAELISIEK